MSDRPLTLIFIASAILIALWLRRARPGGYQQIQTFVGGEIHSGTPETVSPAQAAEEGKRRGIKVEISQPMSREMFEQLMRGG